MCAQKLLEKERIDLIKYLMPLSDFSESPQPSNTVKQRKWFYWLLASKALSVQAKSILREQKGIYSTFLRSYIFKMAPPLLLLTSMVHCISLSDISATCKWRSEDLTRNLITKDNQERYKLDGIIVCLVLTR